MTRARTRQTALAILAMATSLWSSSAYVTSGLPRTTHIAWLKKMTVDICESPPGDLTPEMLQTTPQLMSAWAHIPQKTKPGKRNMHKKKQGSGINKNLQGKDCALAVESLLKRLVDERQAGNPDAIATTDAYNFMLEGWARSGEGGAAAERCEQILEEMEGHFSEDGDKYIQPNYDSFKHVLYAWRESGEPYAPYRALRVLDWMVRLYESGENELAVPDAALFDIVLQMWARSNSKEAPHKAEEILGAMERLYEKTGLESMKPKTTSFNAVLAAWAKSSDKGAADRASAILGFMELLSQAGHEEATPDMVSYSTVVGAMAKTGDPASARKADAFLKRVEAGYKAGIDRLEPDTILYNCVMACGSRSTEKGAYRRTRAILDRQIRLYNNHDAYKCRPDVYGFTSVIASCAMASGSREEKEKAFGVALSTFQQLQNSDSYGSPNHVTYGTMLKACAKLLPTGSPVRRKWVRKIFNQCAKDGYVGDMVVSRFREAACSSLYKELMQGAKRRELPSSWTRNVDEKLALRKRASRPKKTAEV